MDVDSRQTTLNWREHQINVPKEQRESKKEKEGENCYWLRLWWMQYLGIDIDKEEAQDLNWTYFVMWLAPI